jgi:DNA-binding LacI/PurR family transcriptional regulator
VRQSVRALGETSAEAMLRLLKQERPRVSLPPVELIVRESTAPPQSNRT